MGHSPCANRHRCHSSTELAWAYLLVTHSSRAVLLALGILGPCTKHSALGSPPDSPDTAVLSMREGIDGAKELGSSIIWSPVLASATLAVYQYSCPLTLESAIQRGGLTSWAYEVSAIQITLSRVHCLPCQGMKRTMETWTQLSVSREENTEKVATEMFFWMEGMRKRIIQQINK